MQFCKFLVYFLIVVFIPSITYGNDKNDMGGWDIDGKYNRHYDLDEWDEFKGKIVGIKKIVPMQGMSPGVALLVQDSGDEIITVHICPIWYAKPQTIGVRNGDRVRIKGVWAEINGEEFFMASKIKKGSNFEFKVRLTKDGTPFWTLTPEELENELKSD